MGKLWTTRYLKLNRGQIPRHVAVVPTRYETALVDGHVLDGSLSKQLERAG